MRLSFSSLYEKAQCEDEASLPVIAVAAAEEANVLEAVVEARKNKLATAILFGNRSRIESEAADAGLDIGCFEIVDAHDEMSCAGAAARAVRDRKATMLMKGNLATSTFLKAVLDRENGLREDGLLCHVAGFEIADRLFFLSDGGMLISPSADEKKIVVRALARLLKALGIERPEIGILVPRGFCGSEPRRVAEAAELEAAFADGVEFELRMTADFREKFHAYLVPDIETGNILGKTFIYFMEAPACGLVMGAKAPVIMLSRADTPAIKLNSIALATLVAKNT